MDELIIDEFMNKVKIILRFLEKRYGRKIKEFPKHNPFQLLIATILSQRTKDKNTKKATKKLFSVAKTPEEILNLSDKKLEELIKPAGFYRQKSKAIKKVCEIILKEYDGKIPKRREELMKLPGVGYKTSAIVLMYGFNKPIIAIDTHCNRISKRLGLVSKDANVETVRKELESIFPKRKWYLINLGFVNFGKEICRPVNPKCKDCPFRSFCPSFKIKDFDVKLVSH
jgi:endonuclease-3